MSASKGQPSSSTEMKLRRAGSTGIVIGAVAVVACELPIILAAIGLARLGAGAAWLRPPPVVEMIALALAAFGAVVLAFGIAKRILRKHLQERS